VLILGRSGAGKTHLALRLGAVLDLPIIHLDEHRWLPGHVALPDAEWRVLVASLAARPAWIMDGTYESTLELRLRRADAVLLLERRWPASLFAAAWRVVRPRADEPPPPPLEPAFLRYLWRYPTEFRPVVLERIRRCGAHAAVVTLRSRRDADRLVTMLARCVMSRSAAAAPDGGRGRRRGAHPAKADVPSGADPAMGPPSQAPS
jgi:adenylate kinase family enzyme